VLPTLSFLLILFLSPPVPLSPPKAMGSQRPCACFCHHPGFRAWPWCGWSLAPLTSAIARPSSRASTPPLLCARHVACSAHDRWWRPAIPTSVAAHRPPTAFQACPAYRLFPLLGNLPSGRSDRRHACRQDLSAEAAGYARLCLATAMAGPARAEHGASHPNVPALPPPLPVHSCAPASSSSHWPPPLVPPAYGSVAELHLWGRILARGHSGAGGRSLAPPHLWGARRGCGQGQRAHSILMCVLATLAMSSDSFSLL
jgi:hypothetical protein